jgi:hypothetical protein
VEDRSDARLSQTARIAGQRMTKSQNYKPFWDFVNNLKALSFRRKDENISAVRFVSNDP